MFILSVNSFSIRIIIQSLHVLIHYFQYQIVFSWDIKAVIFRFFFFDKPTKEKGKKMYHFLIIPKKGSEKLLFSQSTYTIGYFKFWNSTKCLRLIIL